MSGELQRQAKRPVSAMLAGPYGHPFHPILVAVPIGAWAAGLVFDIASHVVDDPGFLTRGSMWLIAAGVIGALAAATVGFLDLFAIPTGTRAFRIGPTHMSLNLLVAVAYAGNFLWRHADHDRSVSVGAGMLALSAVTLAVPGVSGYLGGKLAYHYGVRVADEATQAEGYLPRDTSRGRLDPGPPGSTDCRRTGRGPRHGPDGAGGAALPGPRRHGHGLFAVLTVVLVLLGALGVGGK